MGKNGRMLETDKKMIADWKVNQKKIFRIKYKERGKQKKQ